MITGHKEATLLQVFIASGLNGWVFTTLGNRIGGIKSIASVRENTIPV